MRLGNRWSRVYLRARQRSSRGLHSGSTGRLRSWMAVGIAAGQDLSSLVAGREGDGGSRFQGRIGGWEQ